jgi:hypothetical protein
MSCETLLAAAPIMTGGFHATSFTTSVMFPALFALALAFALAFQVILFTIFLVVLVVLFSEIWIWWEMVAGCLPTIQSRPRKPEVSSSQRLVVEMSRTDVIVLGIFDSAIGMERVNHATCFSSLMRCRPKNILAANPA